MTDLLETPVMIQPRAVIGELQQVSTVPELRDKSSDKESSTKQEFLDNFDLQGTNLSRKQVQGLQKLLLQIGMSFQKVSLISDVRQWSNTKSI